jgi:hypothetical protein
MRTDLPRAGIRAYADTSVYGGAFEPSFDRESRLFLQQARAGHFVLVYSSLIVRELARAPERVKQLFRQCLPFAEPVDLTEEAVALRNAYLRQTIVTLSHRADALHVALASVGRCEVLVSLDFKHIVQFERISMYNAVNREQGYRALAIHSPAEVVDYG